MNPPKLATKVVEHAISKSTPILKMALANLKKCSENDIPDILTSVALSVYLTAWEDALDERKPLEIGSPLPFIKEDIESFRRQFKQWAEKQGTIMPLDDDSFGHRNNGT